LILDEVRFMLDKVQEKRSIRNIGQQEETPFGYLKT
jgi:hypothetical protein